MKISTWRKKYSKSKNDYCMKTFLFFIGSKSIYFLSEGYETWTNIFYKWLMIYKNLMYPLYRFIILDRPYVVHILPILYPLSIHFFIISWEKILYETIKVFWSNPWTNSNNIHDSWWSKCYAIVIVVLHVSCYYYVCYVNYLFWNISKTKNMNFLIESSEN